MESNRTQVQDNEMDDDIFAQLEAELDDDATAAERERGMREMMAQ